MRPLLLWIQQFYFQVPGTFQNCSITFGTIPRLGWRFWTNPCPKAPSSTDNLSKEAHGHGSPGVFRSSCLHTYSQVGQNGIRKRGYFSRNGLLDGGSYFALVGLFKKDWKTLNLESLKISSQLCPRGGHIPVALELIMPFCRLSVCLPSSWLSFKGKVLSTT